MKLNHRRLAIGLCVLVLAQWTLAQEKPGTDPKRWEKEIAAIEKRDAENAPPKDAVLFIGSSNMRLWKVKDCFPGIPTVNHGFGGSHLADSVYYFDRMVVPVKPKMIVFHAGGNDMNSGKTPQQVADAFGQFVKLAHEKLPDTKLLYVCPIVSPRREHVRAKFVEATKLIQAMAEKDKSVIVIDPSSSLLDKDGKIQPDLYGSDNLHLNAKGYEVLTGLVMPQVKEAMGAGK